MQSNKTALHFSTKISYISLSLSLSLSRLRWLNMYHQVRLISIVLASNSKFFPMGNFKKLSQKYSVNIYHLIFAYCLQVLMIILEAEFI